jgi:hypothetical protein
LWRLVRDAGTGWMLPLMSPALDLRPRAPPSIVFTAPVALKGVRPADPDFLLGTSSPE